ncbi:ABC transporter permease subunit [Halosimplex halophilum]|uniref:ABC transporter permease subunit n=1 Tax=Halosimplex halophilum TaxID=2559572 RepID=UPI00107F314A|nr:ABC transporter permease subunit [Halosimplex halophilum]
MNALTVAHKEVREARRSRLVWALVGLIGVVTLPLVARASERLFANSSVDRMALVLLNGFERPVALAAILVGALAVAAERERGSLRVLSGVSLARRDLVVGKVLGRGLVLAAVVLAAKALAVGILVVRLDGVSPSALGLATALTLLLALAYFGIAVGASLVTGTRLRALALALGVYVFFANYWEGVVVRPVFRFLNGRPPVQGELDFVIAADPEAIQYLQVLNPNNAYTGANHFHGAIDWFSLGVLVAWGVVPVAVGYLRFRNRDLDAGAGGRLAALRRRLDAVSVSRPQLPTPSLPVSVRDRPALSYALADLAAIGRSWLVPALVVVLVGEFVLAALRVPGPSAAAEASLPALGTAYGPLFGELGTPYPVVIATVLLGALAIVDETETGRLKVVTEYPVTRRDVVVGKLAGRAALYVAAVLVGALAAVAILWVRPTAVDPGPLALGVAAMAGVGLSLFGISVGISAFAGGRITAIGASFGAILVITRLWRTLVGVPYWLVEGEFPRGGDLAYAPGSPPEWYHYLQWANPANAYGSLGIVSGSRRLLLAGVLAFWFVVPVAVGYWRFRSRDIE